MSNKNTNETPVVGEKTVPHQTTGETVTVVKDGVKTAIFLTDAIEAEETASKLEKLKDLAKRNTKAFAALGVAAVIALIAVKKYNTTAEVVENDEPTDENTSA